MIKTKRKQRMVTTLIIRALQLLFSAGFEGFLQESRASGRENRLHWVSRPLRWLSCRTEKV